MSQKITKNAYIIYGYHTSMAAINNSKRNINIIYSCDSQISKDIISFSPEYKHLIELISPRELSKLLPPDAVHQGIAVELQPLSHNIDDILSINQKKNDKSIMVILDNITDPHNIGAILRSAAAFEVSAVITCEHDAPSENATIAKIACGALEIVPYIKIRNIADFIDNLKKQHYWFIGLDGSTELSLIVTPSYSKTVLILGSESKGLRKLTRQKCDLVAKLDISANMESLNVSNAAAIALFIERNIKI